MTPLEELLVTRFRVAAADLEKARAFQERYGGRLENILVNMGSLSEDGVVEVLGELLGLPVVDAEALAALVVEPHPGDATPTAFYLERKWLPVRGGEGGARRFVTVDPLNWEVNQLLNSRGQPFQVVLCGETAFRELSTLWEQGRRDQGESALGELTDSEVARLKEMASEAPTVNLVNSLLTRALKRRASDLHLEPFKGLYSARLRIDGVLHDLEYLPRNMELPVVSRLKIMAGMDIAEKRRPQDGKIGLKIASTEVDIRVSCLPLATGESMVLRFLVKESLNYDLEALGLAEDLKARIEEDLGVTAGIILMTGPTGSGKTTTLYSLLSRLNDGQRKIITLEDPVEYQLPGVNQIQVQPAIGFDFAAGLRSVVRQDPDVIMVGEIRDGETARIAMQSAITGHLVFSTVHTNDAPTAYTRLLDLGAEEYLVNAALTSIIAQRLVRRICPHCAVPEENIPALSARYGLAEVIARLGGEARFVRGRGCDQCGQSGYRGRVAVMEYLPCDDIIRALPKDAEFLGRAQAHRRALGWRNLFEDGVLKAMRGVTTLDEVVRVAG